MKKSVIQSIATSIGLSSVAMAGVIDLGAEMPAVKARTQSGELITLNESAKSGYVLVYFYPKADTPGCTKQACSLRDAYEALTEKGVKVFGVSKDSVKDQKAFAEKYTLPFTLLADDKSLVIKAFGVPTYPGVGMAKRQAFLFKDGKLVWRDLKASTEQQAADVLAEIK